MEWWSGQREIHCSGLAMFKGWGVGSSMKVSSREDERIEWRSTCVKERERGVLEQARGECCDRRGGGFSAVATPWGNVPRESDASEL